MQLGSLQFRPSWVPTVVTALLLVLLIFLGVWQLDRAEEKLAMQSEFERNTRSLPLRLDAKVASTKALRFRTVEVWGSYDAEHQFLLDNRTHEGVAGYHVLTPLRIDGGMVGALVNRGWLPVGPNRDVLPDLSLATSAVRVGGIASDAPRTFLLGDAGYESGGWPRVVQSVEFDRMEALLEYRLLPLIVLMAPEQANGFVRQWRPFVGISADRHRAYAVQWFALAVALMIIYLTVNARRGSPGDEA